MRADNKRIINTKRHTTELLLPQGIIINRYNNNTTRLSRKG